MWIFPLVLGSLCCVLSIPLLMQKIPPNLFYGLRTPRTLSDKNLWYKTNRWVGLVLSISSLIAIVGAVGLWILQENLLGSSVLVTSLVLSSLPLITIIVVNLLSYRTKFWLG